MTHCKDKGTQQDKGQLSLQKEHFYKRWALIAGIALVVALLWALGFLAPIVLFLAVGVILAFICSPIVNKLDSAGLSRGLASFIALLVVIVVVALIIVLIGPLFMDQLTELLSKVPQYVSELQRWIADFMAQASTTLAPDITSAVQQFATTVSKVLTDYASQLLANITNGIIPNFINFFNVLFISFLGIVLAFWLAKDYPKMVKELDIIAGPKHKEGLTLVLAISSRSMSGYMKGIVATSVINGVLAFLGFLLVGQPYAPLMGILTCLLHFIPVIGPVISAALATATALFVSPICAVWTLVVAIVAQNITDNVVSPVVMQSAVSVHPAFSLLALVVGFVLGGALGMVISIPFSAALKGCFVYYFEIKTNRQLVSPEGALFQGSAYVYENGDPAPTFDALDNDTFYKDSKVVGAGEKRVMAKERSDIKRRGGTMAASGYERIIRWFKRRFIRHTNRHASQASQSFQKKSSTNKTPSTRGANNKNSAHSTDSAKKKSRT